MKEQAFNYILEEGKSFECIDHTEENPLGKFVNLDNSNPQLIVIDQYGDQLSFKPERLKFKAANLGFASGEMLHYEDKKAGDFMLILINEASWKGFLIYKIGWDHEVSSNIQTIKFLEKKLAKLKQNCDAL